MKGTIKINPRRFCPVISYVNGVAWSGTKRECPKYHSIEIHPKQQTLAFEYLNYDVDWEYSKTDGFADIFIKENDRKKRHSNI